MHAAMGIELQKHRADVDTVGGISTKCPCGEKAENGDGTKTVDPNTGGIFYKSGMIFFRESASLYFFILTQLLVTSSLGEFYLFLSQMGRVF